MSMYASEHACQIILDKAGITGWRLGRSRVFLRYFHEEKLQLLLKEMEDKAILIQKVYRGYRTRKWSVKYGTVFTYVAEAMWMYGSIIAT